MLQIIEKLTRAGSVDDIERIHSEWDQKHGKGKWQVVYQYNGRVYTREQALVEFYDKSYYAYLKDRPDLVRTICETAKELVNPRAVEKNTTDLQVPAVMQALTRLGVRLQGKEKVAIARKTPRKGGYRIMPELSPFNITLWCDPGVKLEEFWQDFKFLAVKV